MTFGETSAVDSLSADNLTAHAGFCNTHLTKNGMTAILTEAALRHRISSQTHLILTNTLYSLCRTTRRSRAPSSAKARIHPKLYFLSRLLIAVQSRKLPSFAPSPPLESASTVFQFYGYKYSKYQSRNPNTRRYFSIFIHRSSINYSQA